MQLYRFSPITTTGALLHAVEYVNEASTQMCKKIVGEVYPISSLTIFAHYQEEFETLKKIVGELGTFIGETLGPRVVLHDPIMTGNNAITHLRIRNPDPYHTHAGSNDYEIDDYVSFKEKFLRAKPHNLILQQRVGYELIEFWDPEFDVLGYVLSEPERSRK